MSNPNKAPGLDLSAFKALYISEAHQDLSGLRQNLAQLTRFVQATPASTQAADPAQAQVLAEAYRLAHRLKGMSAAMRYDTLARVAETIETPLYEAKQAKQLPRPDILDRLERQCDTFQTGLARHTSQPPDPAGKAKQNASSDH